MSAGQIAQLDGTSKSEVLRWLTNHRIPHRKPRKPGKNASMAKEREYYTGQVPYGWKRHNNKLVPHTTEQRVIKTIQKLHREGKSYRTIARHLNQKRTRTKNGKKWRHQTVRQILDRKSC